MPGLLLTGVNSAICKEFKTFFPDDFCFELTHDLCDMSKLGNIDKETILKYDKIVLAHGKLLKKQFLDCTENEIFTFLNINLLSIIKIVEIAWENPHARIVILGSESGEKGSYDTVYWLSKSMLHSYVREKKLQHPGQQIVCLAPSMIVDTGMTAQKSTKELRKIVENSPKKRGITPLEIAQWLYFLLFTDQGYTTNTVIEVNGGKFARQM